MSLLYFIIEADSRIRVIHKTRDSAIAAMQEVAASRTYNYTLVLKEIRVNARGVVVSETITHTCTRADGCILASVETDADADDDDLITLLEGGDGLLPV